MALLLLALSISLGSAFPAVAADATMDGSQLSIELTVTVDEALAATTVVAHIGSSSNQSTFQLGPEGDNVYSGLLSSTVRNHFVIIEAILRDGSVIFSRAATLAELGVDEALLGGSVAGDGTDIGIPIETDSPGLLVPALLVLAAVIAFLMTVRVFRRGVQSPE
ncbi:MAG: hypothetical protein KJO36_02460 [Acidimicrobiia bacterium]|nr:hypothetical protein [Acidimicrobiia bacterium]